MADDSRSAVRDWVDGTLGIDHVDIVRVPQLSTPAYDFYVVSQRQHGHAGEVYAMSDGDAVLPAGKDNLARVLEREGVLDDPTALPPVQLAELYLRMAEVRRVRVLHDASDFALEGLDPKGRRDFTPPTAARTNDGVELTFWTAGPDPSRVDRWRVRLARDRTLTHETEQMS